MVSAWEDVFEASGFSIQELEGATRIVASSPPKWRSDHLLAIQAAIRDARLRRWKAQQEAMNAANEADQCRLCQGTGWAIVPHPKCYVDGKWSASETGAYYTAAVACRCYRGQVKIDRVLALSNAEREQKRVQLPLSLGQYERTFPQWESEVEQHELSERKRLKATAEARHFDDLYGPILQRLAAGVKS